MTVVAEKNCQNIVYTQQPMHHGLITHAERPKIVDAPLKPIFIMGQGTWLYLFSQYWQPILWVCIVTTKSLLNYLTYKSKNCGRSVDAHILNGAGSVLLLLLPMKEANTSVMTICNECRLWLPRMQDLKSLMLCWRSFPGWGREHLCTYFDHKGGQFSQKGQQCTMVNILRLTVEYLNATIKRTTRNAKLEIRPDESCQSWPIQWVDEYRAGFGPPRSRGSGFWTVPEPNQTVFLTKPGLLAGYPDPLLTLLETE